MSEHVKQPTNEDIACDSATAKRFVDSLQLELREPDEIKSRAVARHIDGPTGDPAPTPVKARPYFGQKEIPDHLWVAFRTDGTRGTKGIWDFEPWGPEDFESLGPVHKFTRSFNTTTTKDDPTSNQSTS